MLIIAETTSFTSEVLIAISQFANGNVFVGFTVLITLLSAGLIYVAIKKEKIDRKFFPLLWFFVITNFLFSASISMIALPLKKEAEAVTEEYDDLRVAISNLEDLASTQQENVNYLIKENEELRGTLKKVKADLEVNLKNKKSTRQKNISKITIPKAPKILKTQKSYEEIKQNIVRLDSLHAGSKTILKRKKIPSGKLKN